MRVLIITNMPAPYRIAAWNKVAERLGNDFMVIFCCRREPNRQWNVPEIKFPHIYLRENFRIKNNGTTFVHKNPDVWKHLNSFRPDVIITGGFNPTMLYAFSYSLLKRKKHIPISDAWKESERHLSPAHKLVRKTLYFFSHAFIACSQKGKEYYKSYSLKEESVFISHYTINDQANLDTKAFGARGYDVMFSGQFTERKNPSFFIEVCKSLKQKKSNLKILLIGDGPLRQQLLNELQGACIDFDYPGYVRQEDLYDYYSNSKLFLFPTDSDAWGVVANEALSAGTPVLVTPFAGCSDELVIHNYNGFVLPLEREQWADHCARLLHNEPKWRDFSTKARQVVAQFTHQRAADALIEACAYAYKH